MRLSKEIIWAIAGIAVTVIGIVIAILALGPDEWIIKIKSWIALLVPLGREAIEHKWMILSPLVVGLLAGYLLRGTRPYNVLTANEFEKKYRELFDKHDIRTLLIFGYTYETVRDYHKYEHLYIEGLEIRVLNRCWVAERVDEETYNNKIKNLTLRKWHKAETIHKAAETPWTYKAHREVRYYNFSHPIIKGVILKSKRNSWAFVNFYEWQETPHEGGSQFKGGDLGMISLDSSRPEEASKIRALESQFNLIWKYRSFPGDAANKNYVTYIPA